MCEMETFLKDQVNECREIWSDQKSTVGVD